MKRLGFTTQASRSAHSSGDSTARAGSRLEDSAGIATGWPRIRTTFIRWRGTMAGMQGHFTNYGLPGDADDRGQTTLDGYDPSLGNGEIYCLKDGKWSCTAGRGRSGSWNEDHCVTWVYALCSLGDDLYAAIVRHGVRGLRWIGEVWRHNSGGMGTDRG